MKIGIDGRFWNESGVGRYVRNLVWQLQLLDKKNHYVLFVNEKDLQRIRNQESGIRNKNWKIVSTDIHWHSLEEQIKLPRILEKENLDLMHFPYFSIPVFYSKPFVVTIHDLILHHFSTGEATTRHPLVYHGKRLGYKYIMKQAAKKSQKIIAVSQTTKDEIVKHLKVPDEKVAVTYEGIDDSLKGKGETVKGEGGNFLYVGNAYPHKNLDMVLHAFKKLSAEKNSLQLIVIGKDDYFYKRFQNKVKDWGISNQIIFKGGVADSDLKTLYQNSLGLLAPSLMEGFDLPTVEAMANNCLVLASDIPLHKEILGNAAVYFNPGDENDLIQKLKDVYNNGKEKYTENIRRGSKRTEQFSWKKMAEETLQIYEDSVSV